MGTYNDDESECMYSIDHIRVVGYEMLTDEEKEFISDRLCEYDHVYLKYEYDDPHSKNNLAILARGIRIGYVEPNKSKRILNLLLAGKIGHILISELDESDSENVSMKADVYFESEYGYEELPFDPIEYRNTREVQTEFWDDPEDYEEDWYYCFYTDEICYKFKDICGEDLYDQVGTSIEIQFCAFLVGYLNGVWTTNADLERHISEMPGKKVQEVLRQQIKSYFDYHGYVLKD